VNPNHNLLYKMIS